MQNFAGIAHAVRAAMVGVLLLAAQPTLAQNYSSVEGTRPYCEARWQELVVAGNPRGETHDHFMDRCHSRCPRRDSRSSYEDRTHRYCDERWQRMVLENPGLKDSYNDYSRRCAKLCVATYPLDGAAVFGAWLASFVIVEALHDPTDLPTSP